MYDNYINKLCVGNQTRYMPTEMTDKCCCIIFYKIIINFYGAYILRNLSSEAQQNRFIKHNHEHGRVKVSIRMRDNRTFLVEMQFGIDVLIFFRKIAIVSDVFKVIGSSFQTLGAATEKACLPKLSFVLGTISCEIYDFSCPGIFEICRRLAK